MYSFSKKALADHSATTISIAMLYINVGKQMNLKHCFFRVPKIKIPEIHREKKIGDVRIIPGTLNGFGFLIEAGMNC